MKIIKGKMGLLRKILRVLVLVIIIIILFSIYYLVFMDRESNPIEDNMNYKIETEEFYGRNVFVVSPKSEIESNIIILYMHGGAYIEEMTSDYWIFIEKIVNDIGATVIIPDYPLTPKYSYLDVFNMIEPLYKEILARTESKVILMGDSAGGGMGLALLEKLTEENIDTPSQTILISPWLDVTMTNTQIDEIQRTDTVLNKEVLRLAGIAYAKSEENIKNYLVSPIYGDLSKVDNVTIFTGTNDILNPDVHLLQEKSKEQGAKIKINEYEKAKHIWFIKNNTEKDIVQQGYNDLIKQLKENKE